MKRIISKLYFIGLVPGDPVQSEIMKFKQEAKAIFNAGHALNSPAHITLIPPFSMPVHEESQLINDIKKAVGKIGDIYLELNGFGHFGKRVVFVKTEENDQVSKLYLRLRNELSDYIEKQNHGDKKFHPHITVASRDLKTELFDSAWEYFSKKEYYRVIKTAKVDILRYEQNTWKITGNVKL